MNLLNLSYWNEQKYYRAYFPQHPDTFPITFINNLARKNITWRRLHLHQPLSRLTSYCTATATILTRKLYSWFLSFSVTHRIFFILFIWYLVWLQIPKMTRERRKVLNQYLLGAIRISVDLRQSKINQYCRSSDKIVNFETKILIPFR